jgi:hypothetical protein
MYLRVINSVLLTIILISCTPQFYLPPTPKSNKASRQTATEYYMRQASSKNEIYTSIAFANLSQKEPDSYIKLDELIALKYNKNPPSNIENRIEAQRKIALTDTTTYLFIEEHLYTITKREKAYIITAEIRTNPDYQVREIKEKQRIEIPSDLVQLYEIYVLEKSIENPTFSARPEELVFIRRLQQNEEKSEIKNVQMITNLNILKKAKEANAFSIADYLELLVREDIQNSIPSELDSDEFQSIIEDVNEETNDVLSYQVIYSYRYVKDEMSYTRSKFYRFDEQLNITEKGDI